MNALERKYQSELIRKLESIYPGCEIIRTDPEYTQGIPDIIILYNDKWVALETKRSSKARKQPNQEYYIDKLNNMSYASFIYPENEQEVLNAIQRTFEY